MNVLQNAATSFPAERIRLLVLSEPAVGSLAETMEAASLQLQKCSWFHRGQFNFLIIQRQSIEDQN